MPCRARQVGCARLRPAARVSRSTSDFGSSSVRRRQQRLHHLVLGTRLQARFDLALEVGPDLGAHLRRRRRRRRPALARTRRRPPAAAAAATFFTVTSNVAGLAGHVLAVIVGGKLQLETSCSRRPSCRAPRLSNSGSIRPSPSMNWKSFGLAALERAVAVDRAVEVDRHAVARPAPARCDLRRTSRAACAGSRCVLSTSASPTSNRRTLDRRRRTGRRR